MEDTMIENINGVPLIKIKKALLRTRPQVKGKRPIWTSEEITKMIQIIKEKNILSLLYGGKYRRNDVFKVVAANLMKSGYIRTAEQISTKWKHLRLTYAHAKAEIKSGIVPSTQECAYYAEMDDLLGDKLRIVGIDDSEEILESQEDEKIDQHGNENIEQVIEDEVQLEFSETDYSQIDFSAVEVIQTNACESDVNVVDVTGSTGQEEVVQEYMIHMEEPQSEFENGIESEAAEDSPATKAKKRKLSVKNQTERTKKSNEGSYANALKNFTKEWENMMLRVAEKEREQDRIEKEREKAEQRRWEERLIEAQSEAMTRANVEFLSGLRGIFDEFRK